MSAAQGWTALTHAAHTSHHETAALFAFSGAKATGEERGRHSLLATLRGWL